MPAGSESPCNAGARLGVAHFLIPREWVDKANATAAINERLEDELEKCAEDLAIQQRENQDQHSWGTTIAVGAAALGVGFGLGIVMMAVAL